MINSGPSILVLLWLKKGGSHGQSSTFVYKSLPTTAVLSMKLMEVYVDTYYKYMIIICGIHTWSGFKESKGTDGSEYCKKHKE